MENIHIETMEKIDGISQTVRLDQETQEDKERLSNFGVRPISCLFFKKDSL